MRQMPKRRAALAQPLQCLLAFAASRGERRAAELAWHCGVENQHGLTEWHVASGRGIAEDLERVIA